MKKKIKSHLYFFINIQTKYKMKSKGNLPKQIETQTHQSL